MNTQKSLLLRTCKRAIFFNRKNNLKFEMEELKYNSSMNSISIKGYLYGRTTVNCRCRVFYEGPIKLGNILLKFPQRNDLEKVYSKENFKAIEIDIALNEVKEHDMKKKGHIILDVVCLSGWRYQYIKINIPTLLLKNLDKKELEIVTYVFSIPTKTLTKINETFLKKLKENLSVKVKENNE